MWQTLGDKGILIHGFQLSLLNYFFKVKEMNVCIWIQLNPASMFYVFFFFFLCVNSNLTWVHYVGGQKSRTIYHYSSTVHALKNIKNESYGIIYTFKNYFAIVLLVFSFSNNKFNPNGPITKVDKYFKLKWFYNFRTSIDKIIILTYNLKQCINSRLFM